MTDDNSQIQFVLAEIDRQRNGFNDRRTRYARKCNWLTISHVLATAFGVGLVAANIHYADTGIAIAAMALTLSAAVAERFLHDFKFRERLSMAVATVSRLHTLAATIRLELAGKRKFDEESVNDYFVQYQRILSDANQAWSGQIQATIEEAKKHYKRDISV